MSVDLIEVMLQCCNGVACCHDEHPKLAHKSEGRHHVKQHWHTSKAKRYKSTSNSNLSLLPTVHVTPRSCRSSRHHFLPLIDKPLKHWIKPEPPHPSATRASSSSGSKDILPEPSLNNLFGPLAMLNVSVTRRTLQLKHLSLQNYNLMERQITHWNSF